MTDLKYGLVHQTCLRVARELGNPSAAEVLAAIERRLESVPARRCEEEDEVPEAAPASAKQLKDPDRKGQFGLF